VGNRKRTQEKAMPQSDNHLEMQAAASEQVPDDIDAALDAALDKAGVNMERKAIKDAAAAEERRSAALIAQVNAAQEEPASKPAEDESLVSVMSQGREHLMQRMREHAEKTAAKKEEYKPPPLTEKMRAVIDEEQAAGIRVRERHEREQASRPPPPAKEKWDGSNTPVHRPGSLVPDPTIPARGGFAAGTKQYSADA
jgi:hypothetical protein